jgi:hypothetical protein
MIIEINIARGGRPMSPQRAAPAHTLNLIT